MATSNFSSVVMLTDLDDFINPSQECVKPVKVAPKTVSGSAKIQIGQDGNHTQTINGQVEKLERAKITLNDCLACSGCITSAETVLIGQQSHIEFLKTCDAIKSDPTNSPFDGLVVGLSFQPILSFAAKFGISPLESRSKLSTLFRQLGALKVYDVESFSDLCLHQCGIDFVDRFKEKSTTPVLASACPGWICYAEKTHGTWILPHVSEIKSAQQLAGKFFKDVLPNRLEVNRLAVAMVMPCFDKKLEASRNDFIRQDVKDVDYVITPVEIEQILDQLLIDFVNLNQSAVDSLLPGVEFDSEWSIPAGSGSGGFADHVLRYAAKELFGQTLDSVEFKIGKNSDVREAVLEKDGKTLLTVAVINGFKNIQNLVQKMKRKKCNYDYVEVMACPSGCLNGGAQLKNNQPAEAKTLVVEMDRLYSSIPQRLVDEGRAAQLASAWNRIDCGALEEQESKNYRTEYHAVPKSTNALTVKW